MSPVPELRRLLLQLNITADPGQFLAIYTLTIARLGAALPFIPFLGGPTVPGQVRVGLVMLIGIVLYPALSNQLPGGQAPDAGLYLALLLKELVVGSLIGVLVQIVFAAVEGAGSLIEFAAELKPQQIQAPQVPAATGPLSSLMGQAAIVIYLSAGLHLIFLRALADSYTVIPLAAIPRFRPGLVPLAEFAGRITSGFIVTAFQLSAPFILVLALMKIGSNLIFRMSFAGLRADPLQPLGSLAVFGILFLSAGLLSEEILRQALGYLASVRQFVQAIR